MSFLTLVLCVGGCFSQLGTSCIFGFYIEVFLGHACFEAQSKYLDIDAENEIWVEGKYFFKEVAVTRVEMDFSLIQRAIWEACLNIMVYLLLALNELVIRCH